MACSITIDVNAAVAFQDAAGDPPSSIQISGTAVDCDVVVVRLTTANPSQEVQADVVNGQWTVTFTAPGDFDPNDFPCGLKNIKVNARCKDDGCEKDEQIAILNCQPSDCPPQAGLIVFRGGDPNDLVDTAACLADGSYTVRIVDPVSATAVYQWSVNGVSQTAVSGSGLNELVLTLAIGGPAQFVSAGILFSPTCFLSTGVLLTPCPAPPPPDPACPAAVALEVRRGGVLVTDLSGCLEPGSYTITVTNPVGANISYSWSIDNSLQPAQTGASLSLTLPAGETRSVQVSAAQPNCPVVPASVTLTACAEEPPPDCAETITLQVVDVNRQPVVTGGDCLPLGTYTVVVTDPAGPGVTYAWRVNGQPQAGETGRAFSYTLAAGEDVTISVAVQAPGCPRIREQIALTGCARPRDCAQAVSITVLDANNAPVDPTAGCLPPGRYRLRVDAPSGAGVTYTWSVDNQVQAGQTGSTFDIALLESQSVNVAVSAVQPDCDPVPGGVQLIACPPPPPPPPPYCPWLFYGGLVLLIIGLVLTFAGFCTGNIPLDVLGLILAFAGFGLLIAWALLCAPAAGGCELLRRLIQFLSLLTIVLVLVAASFGVIAAICAGITSPTGILLLLCGLPAACGIGALIDFGIVGGLLAILALIYFEICE